jgi:hypothetical protein
VRRGCDCERLPTARSYNLPPPGRQRCDWPFGGLFDPDVGGHALARRRHARRCAPAAGPRSGREVSQGGLPRFGVQQKPPLRMALRRLHTPRVSPRADRTPKGERPGRKQTSQPQSVFGTRRPFHSCSEIAISAEHVRLARRVTPVQSHPPDGAMSCAIGTASQAPEHHGPARRLKRATGTSQPRFLVDSALVGRSQSPCSTGCQEPYLGDVLAYVRRGVSAPRAPGACQDGRCPARTRAAEIVPRKRCRKTLSNTADRILGTRLLTLPRSPILISGRFPGP